MTVEERLKKIEMDTTQLRKVANVLTKQISMLVVENTKFKNTIHQLKLDIETLKRKP